MCSQCVQRFLNQGEKTLKTLIPILLYSVILAYLTERTAVDNRGNIRATAGSKLCFVLLVCVLALPIGLRTSYNDTYAYIKGFRQSMELVELFQSGELHILKNPAFRIYESVMHGLTDNYHIFFMLPAFFTQYAFAKTIQRYAHSFPIGITLYFFLGTYVFSFAALKQTIAMAILALAIPKLLDKKYGQFYLLTFMAFLFHTYAIVFAVLPIFTVKPWGWRTFALLFVVFAVVANFEPVIGSFLDYASEQGKEIAEYEVFDNNQINTFRVAVYAVVPLLSLIFGRYLGTKKGTPAYNLLIHMSIISCAFMILGTVNGANMFGRMANYFEIGMICSLTWIIDRVFTKSSARLIVTVALACFFGYFYYAYRINLDFDANYYSVTILQFIKSLFSA